MTEILEQGDISFAYRPRVEQERVRSVQDVQQLFMILHAGNGRVRRIVMGRRRLPQPEEHERFWGFVTHLAYQLELPEQPGGSGLSRQAPSEPLTNGEWR